MVSIYYDGLVYHKLIGVPKDMTQAYRSSGGAAQYVTGGLQGKCLSDSHREFKQGFDDRRDNKELLKHGSSTYMRGAASYDKQELRLQQALECNKVMRELGISKKDWLYLKRVQKNNIF